MPKEISTSAWNSQESVTYEPFSGSIKQSVSNAKPKYQALSSKLYSLSDSTDFSYVHYYGDSYLKFQNVLLNPRNTISLEFQTPSSHGLLLYIKQDSNSVDGFFIQLFIENGTLKVSH